MKAFFTKITAVTILTLVSTLITFNNALAQCPMCKAAAESNLKEGGTAGAGLNQGIIYLFLSPYLIVGTIALLWYWNYRKNNQMEELENEY